MQRLLLLGMTVCLLALALPSVSHAQRGGGGAHGGGGARPVGVGPRGVGNYNHGGYGGIGNYNRYGSGYYGYGRVGYGYGYSGLYLGYGRYNPDYGYLYFPGYADSDFGLGYTRPAYYPPSDEAAPSPAPAARLGNKANIRVILPNANAKLLVDGTPTTSTGETRTLETPELQPGDSYHYDLTATWVEGARTITEKRRIEVTPGAVTVVDFTRPAPKP